MMFVKSLLDIADRLASDIYRQSERKWSQRGTWTIRSLYFKHFLYKITTRKGFGSISKKSKNTMQEVPFPKENQPEFAATLAS
jgi:hypothetical protein